MLLFIIVVTMVVQNYFYTAQIDQFRANEEYTAQQIGQQYPVGFSPYEFLAKVDKAILITGSVIAIIVISFSLWLARRLTKPLTSLTFAAEQMGEGNYDQRVVTPKSRDELGRLALSFNSM